MAFKHIFALAIIVTTAQTIEADPLPPATASFLAKGLVNQKFAITNAAMAEVDRHVALSFFWKKVEGELANALKHKGFSVQEYEPALQFLAEKIWWKTVPAPFLGIRRSIDCSEEQAAVCALLETHKDQNLMQVVKHARIEKLKQQLAGTQARLRELEKPE